jgi:hypothetical protein
MTDFPIARIRTALALGVSLTAQGDEAMKHVTTAALRREQNIIMKEAVAVMGEDVVHMLIDAVTQQSEAPLMDLPDEWRDRAIAAFRQFIKKIGRKP